MKFAMTVRRVQPCATWSDQGVNMRPWIAVPAAKKGRTLPALVTAVRFPVQAHMILPANAASMIAGGSTTTDKSWLER